MTGQGLISVGGVIDVTYVLDTPHGYEWKGVFADANLRAMEVTPSHSPLPQGGEGDRQKTFMQLSALQGSILENRIFEDDFQVESISTAKLFEIVNTNLPPTPIITIDKTNVDSMLPSLPFDEQIKTDITNAVNQNLNVKIPQSDVNKRAPHHARRSLRHHRAFTLWVGKGLRFAPMPCTPTTQGSRGRDHGVF